MTSSASLYKDYEKKMQRAELFKLLTEHYSIKKAMYPGSYIHISPSFYIPEVVYIDTDAKAKRFFKDDSFKQLIEERKKYSIETIVRFYSTSYKQVIPEEEGSFDLIISQYAGPVSLNCKKFLKSGGYLVANNSHGDAGIADLDSSFKLIAVINFRGGKFYHSTKNLDSYFLPKKKELEVTLDYLLEIKKGIGYTKTASHYLFQKN